MMQAKSPFLFDWAVNAVTGWGVYGRNLVKFSAISRGARAIPIYPVDTAQLGLDPSEFWITAPSYQQGTELSQQIKGQGQAQITINLPIFHALGNSFQKSTELSAGAELIGGPSVAVHFFEEPQFNQENVTALNNTYASHIAGSSWNYQLLKDAGVNNVQFVMQGVDTSIFHPAPNSGIFKDRFVIFSGGKLEPRKGQDLVLKAFRFFSKRHPDALLVAAWTNFWPNAALEINANSTLHPLKLRQDGHLDILTWFIENGINKEQVLCVEPMLNGQFASLFREVDIGLFPNRAEGGTNLVAMELMATGKPVIISQNTGHTDLVFDGHDFILQDQIITNNGKRRGWGESNVDEIADLLEKAYKCRDKLDNIGSRFAHFMHNFSWGNQVKILANTLTL